MTEVKQENNRCMCTYVFHPSGIAAFVYVKRSRQKVSENQDEK